MAGKLSFAVAINLLTENFKRGSNELKNGFRNIQMQAMSMFAALGAGSIGFSSLVSNMIQTARETSRVNTALKNVSGDSISFGKNQEFLISLSKKYGLYINDLTNNFAGFTAAANASNVSITDQQRIFESLSRAAVSFGLSADQSNGMFLAVQQMMSKGKISAEELRGQLGERLPIAMQAMAKAVGVPISELDNLMKQGKLLSADVLPKFADALNSMVLNVDTNNIESSFNKLKNSFKEFTDKVDVGNFYKNLIDETNELVNFLMNNFKAVADVFVNIITTIMISKGIKFLTNAYKSLTIQAEREFRKQAIAAGVAFDGMGTGITKFSKVAKFALSSIAKAFLPMAIISGLIAIYQHFQNIAQKNKELKAIWNDYSTGLKNAGQNDLQVKELRDLQNVVNDTNKSYDIRKTALNEINRILGTNYTIDSNTSLINSDINGKIKERLNLLEKQAELNYAINAKMDAGSKMADVQNKVDVINSQIRAEKQAGNGVPKKLVKERLPLLRELEELTKVYNNASDQVINIKTDIEKISPTSNSTTTTNSTPTTTTTNSTPTTTTTKKDKTDLQKAEENYKNTIIEYDKQLKNGVITQSEYNKKVDELNNDTFEKLGGMLTPEQAAKNKTFQTVKSGVDNPKFDSVSDEYIKEQDKYNKELSRLTKLKQLGELSDSEYNSELENLINSTINSILSIDNIGDAADEYIKILSGEKRKLQTEKKDFSKYEYKSKFELIGKSETELIEIKLDEAKKQLDELIKKAKEKGKDLTDDLTNELNSKLNEVEGLDKALHLIEVKEKIKDLKKELNNSIYDGVKDIASTAKNMFEAFKNVRDTINDVDATGWEKFLSIWNALTSTVDGIMSVLNIISNLTNLTNELAAAKQREAIIDTVATNIKTTNAATATSVTVANAATQTAANTSVAATGAAASVAGIPLAGVGLAVGAVATIISLLSSLPKFANGGIVGGSSYSGDKILARINSGELILNQGQQGTLYGLLNNNSSTGGGKVEFRIDGKTLKGVLTNYDSIKSKVK